MSIIQAFEKYPPISDHLLRMESTGNTGSSTDWSEFLWALHSLICSKESELRSAKEHIEVISTELDWERGVVQAELERQLREAQDIIDSLLKMLISAGVENDFTEQTSFYLQGQPITDLNSIDNLPF